MVGAHRPSPGEGRLEQREDVGKEIAGGVEVRILQTLALPGIDGLDGGQEGLVRLLGFETFLVTPGVFRLGLRFGRFEKATRERVMEDQVVVRQHGDWVEVEIRTDRLFGSG